MQLIKNIISYALIAAHLIMLIGIMPAKADDPVAPNWVCAQDLNNNGYVGDEGEYSSCKTTTINNSTDAIASCPTGYVQVGNGCQAYTWTSPTQYCPTGFYVQNGRCVIQQQLQPTLSCPARFGLEGGECRGPLFADAGGCSSNVAPGWTVTGCNIIREGAGRPVFWIPTVAAKYLCSSGTLTNGQCVVNEDAGPVQLTCPTGTVLENGQCKKTTDSGFNYSCTQGTLSGTQCIWSTTENYCPIGVSQSCLDGKGGASCSPNKCINITENPPVDEGNIDGSMLIDDGKRNDEGVCMDQLFIFSGRAQDCKLAGISTAFKNCCKNEGKVFTDSAGALGTISTAASTISKVYDAAQEAYTYYTVAMQATGDAAVASSMAAQGFGNSLVVAFDPTSLAVSVAIYFAMEYLMKACDQQSMETAMAAGSGYCHEVGTYCKKKIPLLGCVQKATSYCCFNSKLARIIHEQGRPQLNGFDGWGNAGSPSCRGFTPDEFSAIDFGKIDLSEYVEDMVKKATSEIQQNVNQITQDFYDKTN